MTIARETLALSAYFGTYHRLRESCNSFVSGGAAGLASWTLTFPETLRTRSDRAEVRRGRGAGAGPVVERVRRGRRALRRR